MTGVNMLILLIELCKFSKFYHHMLTLENQLLSKNGLILNPFSRIPIKSLGSHSIKSEISDTNENSV